MKRIQHQSTLNLVVHELRDACLQEQWQDKLPGVRILARRLGVSPPTIHKALCLLAEEGLLVRPGPRKAFRLKTTPGSRQSCRADRRTKQVIILTHLAINELVATTRTILDLISTQLISEGWQVRKVVVNFVHTKTAHQSWEKIIDADETTPIIAVYGRPVLAEWALKRSLKILFFGGERDRYDVPVIGVRSHELVKQAMDRLIDAGHRKIVVPLLDRPKLFAEKLCEVTRECIEHAGGVYQASYHNPQSPYGTSDVSKGIMLRMIPDNLPSAMVLLDWNELVTVHCCLAQHGLKVPDDVSLILLNDQVEAGWFEPPLCRFSFPHQRMARAVCEWLNSGQPMDRAIKIPANYVPGKTIAPPRNQVRETA